MKIEEAKSRVAALVERFRENLDVYKAGSYNETQVRVEFIDHFFEALGWDIHNKNGHAEQYKDVVHEESLKVGGSLKAPDYSFRIGGQRKFFLEAKKPFVSIKEDPAPAYQLRRYAWSAKLPLSVLTDFEELAIYDCRIQPNEKDKVSTGRVAYYNFEQYLDKFDEIYGILSIDAVLKGSFDRYSESTKLKKGTAAVDSAFLEEIESWRDLFARNIAIRNQGLSVDELNFAVQHTIDRIIFLRICEDRGIEDYGRLQALLNGSNVYGRLLELFYKADDKYNSGLFDFKSDRLSHSLSIDDKALKHIIENLYYPKSPYEFSVIGADILGNVYEQFLGKVIRLTSGHQAKVEEKPEVKKAGGVFYTPEYIVDYIVKNTVGKLLEGKTPKQAEKLRVLDPACGSGSFLIGAYQYLLDWHMKWYTENDPEKYTKGKAPAVFHGKGGWRLTTSEKKKILLNNIFGVDIDRQAVEVTKLSLLLKVLEDENHETIGKNLALFHERVLPNLDRNIKCGNSLVSPDFYSQMDLGMGAADARVNVFDWNDENRGFGSIMKEGGFDCVIGNPPYVRQEMLGSFKPYFERHYKTYDGVADLYVYFIEKGVQLLKEGGLFSYIVANKWMRANYGEELRSWLKTQQIEEIIDFGDLRVFQKATTYPCIIRLGKGKVKTTFSSVKVDSLDFKGLDEYLEGKRHEVSRASLDDKGWSLADGSESRVLGKIRAAGISLGEYVEGKIYYGIKTGFNEAFVIDAETKDNITREEPQSKELIKPFLVGKDIKRYRIEDRGRYLILVPKGWTETRATGFSDKWKWFNTRHPVLANHLLQYKATAEKRCDMGDYWWELRACEYYDVFVNSKIIIPCINKRASNFIDSKGFFSNDKTTIIPEGKYFLGLLNSRLLDFVLHSISSTKQGGYYEYKPMYLSQLPIKKINFKNKDEKNLHTKIESLVDRMHDLQEDLKAARTPHEKELFERQIEMLDRQIDALVYELYGLTAEEIKVVEAGQ